VELVITHFASFLERMPAGIRLGVTIYLTAYAVRSVFVAAHDHGVNYPNGRVGRIFIKLFHGRNNPHA
jgi:hypothetical protein